MRSSRTQALLLAALIACLLVSGTAFASTFQGQIAYQNRDHIELSTVGIEMIDGDRSTLQATIRITNPTGLPVEVSAADAVAYAGGPPFSDAQQLTLPRSGTLEQTRIPAGESRAVQLMMTVEQNESERLQQAIKQHNVSISGSVYFSMRGKSFILDV